MLYAREIMLCARERKGKSRKIMLYAHEREA